MSALDDAYRAAAEAAWREDTDPPEYHEFAKAGGDVCEDYEALSWAAVRAFLAHLADNPPDEMVEAGACALAVQDGWCTEKQWSEEVDPDESRQWDERVCPVLSAALRSLTIERAST